MLISRGGDNMDEDSKAFMEKFPGLGEACDVGTPGESLMKWDRERIEEQDRKSVV